MANTTTAEVKYFQLDGGATVLQHDSTGWIRWDIHDGLVPTNVPWTDDDPRIRQISLDEAIALMK